MKNFNGKTVVITGGATGIGFALAKHLAAEGANIVISGRRLERLEEATSTLKKLGTGGAKYFQCDVSSDAEMTALADFAWDAFGSVNVLINNAGVGGRLRSITKASLDDVRALFETNFYGVWRGSAIFGRRFIEQGEEAAIYNVGSENSLFNGLPKNAAYVASKHAVLALTEGLREEMPDFVHVGLICPGFVQSEIGDEAFMSKGMEADKFAEIAVRQMKDGAFFIVSHAYNMVRIDARYQDVKSAYATYAPRYDGDDEYDARMIMKRVMSGQA